MVTKLYIDNYKGFVDFHVDFGRIVFLMGRNGSGKTSLLEVLHMLAMAIHDGNIEDLFDAETRFRFADEPDVTQRFRIDLDLAGKPFRYELEIGFVGRELRPIVVREELWAGDLQQLLFDKGFVHLNRGDGNSEAVITLDPHRTALSTIGEQNGGPLARLIDWAEGFVLLKLEPGAVKSEARKPGFALDTDGRNFAAWYETVANDDNLAGEAYRKAMREILPGLRTVNLKGLYKSGKLWEAKFEQNGKEAGFALDELSDGQISLAVLYAILHFSVRSGATIALDEPDNYLGLAEIEPFIYELEDKIGLHRAQAFVISHHPDIYNQWARDPERCRNLDRTDDGRFEVRAIDWDENPGLTPAEVVARGWQDA